MTDQPTAGVIFCAGFGTRMRDLVQDRPKPMVPLGGRPMVARSVELLKDAGIKDIFANTHHLAPVIEPYLSSLGVRFRRETPEILDTGGGLKALAPDMPQGPIVTLNPDAAWHGPNPVTQLREAWRPSMDCLLLLVPAERTERSPPADFGLTSGQVFRGGSYVYTGVQIVRTQHITSVGEDKFSLNVVWDKLIAGRGVDAVVYEGEWRDIGTPEGLAAAESMLADVRA